MSKELIKANVKLSNMEDGGVINIRSTNGNMIEFERLGDKIICAKSIGYAIEKVVELTKMVNNES